MLGIGVVSMGKVCFKLGSNGIIGVGWRVNREFGIKGEVVGS